MRGKNQTSNPVGKATSALGLLSPLPMTGGSVAQFDLSPKCSPKTEPLTRS